MTAWIIAGALALVGIVFVLVLMRVFSVDQTKITEPKKIKLQEENQL